MTVTDRNDSSEHDASGVIGPQVVDDCGVPAAASVLAHGVATVTGLQAAAAGALGTGAADTARQFAAATETVQNTARGSALAAAAAGRDAAEEVVPAHQLTRVLARPTRRPCRHWRRRRLLR